MYGLPRLSSNPILYLPLWLGTLRDVSGNSNDVASAVLSNWIENDGISCVYTSGTGRLVLSERIDLASGTIYFHFPRGITRQYANQIFTRRAGVRQLTFYSTNGTNISMYDGTTASSYVYSYLNKQSLAVTWTDSAVPNFYADGYFIGVGNNIMDTFGATSDTELLGWSVSGPDGEPCSAILFFDSVLSATDINRLHEYFDSRISARRQFPGAGISTGQPLYRDNIQSARVSLADETAGQLSNTGYTIESGSWRVKEDSSGRWIECITAGIISRRTNSAYNTFEFELSHSGAANTIVSFINDNVPISVTGYDFRINSQEAIILYELTAGGVVTTHYFSSNSYLSENTRYKFRITRSDAGEFSMFAIGGDFTTWTLLANAAIGTNPFTDTTIVNSNYATFNLTAGDKLYLDQHYAGVITP